MKTAINFCNTMTLLNLVIKEKFRKMWVVGPYFVWVTVSEALFWVSVGCFGWVGHYFGLVGVNGVYRTLFWVGGGQWGWVGHYFGWVGVGGKIFWVGGGGWGEWGWVHCALQCIMPINKRLAISNYRTLHRAIFPRLLYFAIILLALRLLK